MGPAEAVKLRNVIRYGHLGWLPVRYIIPTEAWGYDDIDGWARIHPAELAHNGRMLSRQQFERQWPNLPPLPDEAFKHR